MAAKLLFLFAVFVLVGIFAISSFATNVSVTTATYQAESGELIYAYFETSSGPGSATPSTNTAFAPPATSSQYQINRGSSGYLWTPQFASATTISAGDWALDLWAADLPFVPITITNSQTSATSNPFQEMITINPSSYSSYEASNLGNIRFCTDTACATELHAWLESCTTSCSTSATSATIWVKLTSSIAANGGTVTIYMVFLPTSNNFGNYWGEAPTLSSNYGQYDNGANVFNLYDNFAGTTLSSQWQAPIESSGGTVSVNNGITFNVATTNDYTFIATANTVTFPAITEMLFDPGSTSTAGISPMIGETTGTTASSWVDLCPGYEYDWTTTMTNSGYLEGSSGCTPTTITSGFATPSSNSVVGFAWDATGDQEVYNSYSNVQSGTDNSIAIANYYPYIGISNLAAGSYEAQWVRTRAYPPSDVMPSVSFGGVTSSGNIGVSIYVTSSAGTILSTIASNVQTSAITSSITQLVMTFAASQVNIPQNGYIAVSLSTSTAAPCTIYYGSGQQTNFQVPYRILSS